MSQLGLPPGIDLNAPENYNLLQTVSRIGQEIAADPAFKTSLLEKLGFVDSSTLITAGVIGTIVVVAGVTLCYYDGAWVRVAPAAPVTGTVWDVIKPTAANLSGTAIPATFQIQNGQRVFLGECKCN